MTATKRMIVSPLDFWFLIHQNTQSSICVDKPKTDQDDGTAEKKDDSDFKEEKLDDDDAGFKDENLGEEKKDEDNQDA